MRTTETFPVQAVLSPHLAMLQRLVVSCICAECYAGFNLDLHWWLHVTVVCVEVMASSACPLEAEDLVRKLADRPRLLVAKLDQTLLHGADHWWWSADQYLDVVCWSWKLGLVYR